MVHAEQLANHLHVDALRARLDRERLAEERITRVGRQAREGQHGERAQVARRGLRRHAPPQAWQVAANRDLDLESVLDALVGEVARQLLAYASRLDARDRVAPRTIAGDAAAEDLEAADDLLQVLVTAVQRRVEDVAQEALLAQRTTEGGAVENAIERPFDEGSGMTGERRIGLRCDRRSRTGRALWRRHCGTMGRAIHEVARLENTQLIVCSCLVVRSRRTASARSSGPA